MSNHESSVTDRDNELDSPADKQHLPVDLMARVATFLDVESVRNLLLLPPMVNNKKNVMVVKKMYMKMMKKYHRHQFLDLSDLYNDAVPILSEDQRHRLIVATKSHTSAYSGATTHSATGYLKNSSLDGGKKLLYEIARDEDNIVELISTYNDVFNQHVEFNDFGLITSYTIVDKLSETRMELNGSMGMANPSDGSISYDDDDDDDDDDDGDDTEEDDDNYLPLDSINRHGDFFASSTYLFETDHVDVSDEDFSSNDDCLSCLIPNIPKKVQDFRRVQFCHDIPSLFGNGITREIVQELMQSEAWKNIHKLCMNAASVATVFPPLHNSDEFREDFLRHTHFAVLQILGTNRDDKNHSIAFSFAQAYKQQNPECYVEYGGVGVKRC